MTLRTSLLRAVRPFMARRLIMLALSMLTVVSISSCSTQVEQYSRPRHAIGERERGSQPPARAEGLLGRSGSLEILVDAPFDEIWVIARESGAPRQERRADDVAVERPGTGALVSTTLDDRGLPTRAFPLESTRIQASLDGPIATVQVAQRFSNPFSDTIEAAYVFPLPHDAAVSDFLMRIGNRSIRGIVRERAEAQRIYADARASGYVASLLTEERPNIFMERVANIEPGLAVDVELTYFNMLVYADGWYEWRFPLVVGPRFNPPGTRDPIPALPVGGSARQGAVDGVEYLRPGQRTGHLVDVDVTLDAGFPIDEIECPSHAVSPAERERHTTRVRMTAHDVEANRDFLLRYRVAGKEPRHGLVSSIGPDGQGTFALTIYPPTEMREAGRMPIDIVFLVDRSGSMRGRPLEQARQAMRCALDHLRPEDRFQIVDFGSDAGAFGDSMRWADAVAISEAKRYIDSIESNGGTMVLTGLSKALAFPKQEGRVQYIAVLGDGFVSNEAEICASLHESLGDRRVFALGVGSSVNWHLMSRMAAVGCGAVAAIALDTDARVPMGRFMDAVTRPIMQGTRLEWSGVRVDDVWPRRMPDLIAGRPVTIVGRYERGGRATARLRGWVRGEEASSVHDLVFADTPDDTLGSRSIDRLWARAKIAQIADDALASRRSVESAEREILSTALTYGISSPYTAFVAVDASRVTEGTRRTTVVQPVALPEGVEYGTTVGVGLPSDARSPETDRRELEK